jgi:uncharacterized protein (DUF433 family)
MEGQRTETGKSFPPSGSAYIVAKAGYCGGKPHIAGHRIKVQHIALWHERYGKDPDEIVADHPGVSLAAVYAALAYYYDHRDEIDADLHSDEQFLSNLRGQGGPSRLLQRLASWHAPSDPLSPR